MIVLELVLYYVQPNCIISEINNQIIRPKLARYYIYNRLLLAVIVKANYSNIHALCGRIIMKYEVHSLVLAYTFAIDCVDKSKNWNVGGVKRREVK